MKPLGLTASLQTIRPKQWEDDLWEAVQGAINRGVSPHTFKREMAEAWEYALKQEIKEARRELDGK